MPTPKNPKLNHGDSCKVNSGSHAGKLGTVQDINISKTGHMTITVLQKNGDRFKTLGRNVEVTSAAKKSTVKTAKPVKTAELKTKKTEEKVDAFLKKVGDSQKQKDCFTIVDMMEKATKAKAKMWGTAMIGFGDRHLKYDSGRELDWFIMGFSPRKQNITLYIPGIVENHQPLLKKLGKHKTGKGCLYINSLEDVDVKVLKDLMAKGLVK